MDGFLQNPAWATNVIARTYETLAETVPPKWLPRLADVRARTAHDLTARVREYGCGAYGCVFPTMDPHTVIKLTADDTEAEFASDLAGSLVRPICVTYRLVVRPDGARDDHGAQLFFLWRESADRVGQIAQDLGPEARVLVNNQHKAGQIAYQALISPDGGDIHHAVSAWLKSCEAMARQTRVPQLRELGDGLVEVYGAQRILFGDIHGGNLGVVRRADGDHWVITDPGHIVVVADF